MAFFDRDSIQSDVDNLHKNQTHHPVIILGSGHKKYWFTGFTLVAEIIGSRAEAVVAVGRVEDLQTYAFMFARIRSARVLRST